MQRIRQGDEVIVTAGKNKGRHGSVLRVYADDRVLVENVNIVKRHTRPNPNEGVSGGIVEREAPIHVSNVMPYNAQTGKAERIGYKTLGDGRKVRFFRSNEEVID